MLIWLTAVTISFVAFASANAVGVTAGSYASFDDDAFGIVCYLDSFGITWVLRWDERYGPEWVEMPDQDPGDLTHGMRPRGEESDQR